jgi:hypothetical protein
MITIRTSGIAPLLVVAHKTSPSVYLDYCVMANFAEKPGLGNRFREILFRKNGTVCFSLMHLLEVSGLGLGPTYDKIKSFFSSVGNRFVVLDFNPAAVIERERAGNNFPALEPKLTQAVIDFWDGLSALDFSTILTGLQKYPQYQTDWKRIETNQRAAFKKMFDDARIEFKNNPSAKKNMVNTVCPDPGVSGTTEFVNFCLRKECIESNDEFNPSDGPDFFHCVVAFSHTDFIVVDKKWARRLKAIDVPTKHAKVFATNEYDAFFESLAT